MILRTTHWDGPAPAAGDVVQLDDTDVAVVQHVAAGPGPGQWRLTCQPTRLIVWWPSGRAALHAGP